MVHVRLVNYGERWTAKFHSWISPWTQTSSLSKAYLCNLVGLKKTRQVSLLETHLRPHSNFALLPWRTQRSFSVGTELTSRPTSWFVLNSKPACPIIRDGESTYYSKIWYSRYVYLYIYIYVKYYNYPLQLLQQIPPKKKITDRVLDPPQLGVTKFWSNLQRDLVLR